MNLRKTSTTLLGIIAVALMGCTQQVSEPKPYNEGINVVPQPVELRQTQEGKLALTKKTVIVGEGEELQKIAQFFANKINASTGLGISVAERADAPKNAITLSLVGTDVVPQEEGYTLDVTPDQGVLIQASTPRGAFWGMQTLLQLLPAEVESASVVRGMDWSIPFVSIKDYPRFSYRGQHVDVGRHFMDVNEIKKTIDLLSMLKINKLHFHLVEDQGWRIEIKKYPKLTAEGATRIEGDGSTYGPYFYTQEEIKDIVAYADERFVEVIPEIELPGHSDAAVAAYPELGCHGADYPYEVRNVWSISTEIYCAGNDDVFTFLKDVIDEVLPLFHTDYFHIGGDEAWKDNWETCPKCRKRIRDNRLKNVEELQSWFIHQIEEYLVSKGKKMIGWEEILQGGLAPSAIVMSWTGEEGGIKSANMGHDVIMTPSWRGMYLDHYQGDPNVEPLAIGGYAPLSKVYAYDPIPEAIDADKRHHVLGVQVNLWSEYFYTQEQYEYMAQPRVAALSEIAWTPLDRKDYDDFVRRINNLQVRYDMHDYLYYIPQPEQGNNRSIDHVVFVGESVEIPFSTVYPVHKIMYTTDGSEPTADHGEEYTAPLTFTDNTTLKIRSVILSGKMSPVREIRIVKEEYAPAVAEETAGYQAGIKVQRADRKFESTDELLAADESDFMVSYVSGGSDIKNSAIAATKPPMYVKKTQDHLMDNILWSGMIYSGYINIPEGGVYRFSTTDSRLWIDGEVLIDNEGEIKKWPTRKDMTIALAKGLHQIQWTYIVEIHEGWPSAWSDVRLQWARFDKDEDLSFIPDDAFFYQP